MVIGVFRCYCWDSVGGDVPPSLVVMFVVGRCYVCTLTKFSPCCQLLFLCRVCCCCGSVFVCGWLGGCC